MNDHLSRLPPRSSKHQIMSAFKKDAKLIEPNSEPFKDLYRRFCRAIAQASNRPPPGDQKDMSECTLCMVNFAEGEEEWFYFEDWHRLCRPCIDKLLSASCDVCCLPMGLDGDFLGHPPHYCSQKCWEKVQPRRPWRCLKCDSPHRPEPPPFGAYALKGFCSDRCVIDAIGPPPWECPICNRWIDTNSGRCDCDKNLVRAAGKAAGRFKPLAGVVPLDGPIEPESHSIALELGGIDTPRERNENRTASD